MSGLSTVCLWSPNPSIRYNFKLKVPNLSLKDPTDLPSSVMETDYRLSRRKSGQDPARQTVLVRLTYFGKNLAGISVRRLLSPTLGKGREGLVCCLNTEYWVIDVSDILYCRLARAAEETWLISQVS